MITYRNGVRYEEPDPPMPDSPEIPNQPAPVTLETLDHRLSDVEYIITGEVATNAQ